MAVCPAPFALLLAAPLFIRAISSALAVTELLALLVHALLFQATLAILALCLSLRAALCRCLASAQLN
eukprot:2263937-Heterocapsa_arctica.AAC.1